MTKRDKYLRRTYGITEAVYQRMLESHNKRCWICNKPAKQHKNLQVDHDHKTGQVRGLLCWFCNKYIIGRRRWEHVQLYVNAALYLQSTYDWRKAKHEAPVAGHRDSP